MAATSSTSTTTSTSTSATGSTRTWATGSTRTWATGRATGIACPPADRRSAACRPARAHADRGRPSVRDAVRGAQVGRGARIEAWQPEQREPGPRPELRRGLRRELRRELPVAAYRRRRAFVGTLLAAVVACGIVLTHDVLAGSGGVPASAATGQPALVERTVTARPGDTLWSIAERYHGDVALARYVDKLVAINGGPSIQAGQAVALP